MTILVAKDHHFRHSLITFTTHVSLLQQSIPKPWSACHQAPNISSEPLDPLTLGDYVPSTIRYRTRIQTRLVVGISESVLNIEEPRSQLQTIDR